MIELRDVSKSFGEVKVLDSFDLSVQAGLTTALIGPSGCGKSTLLRLIMGLIRPDRGRIYFRQTEVEPQTILDLRKKMGYVIQEGGLFPHLSARDNITLLARYLRREKGAIDERLTRLAELTRFPFEALGRFPVQLSGGQRQRVSLMRALMLDPDALLLDEPLGALDPLIRADLQADLKRIFQELQKTVVLVTHDMGEAAYFSDEIVLLHDGRIVQKGSLLDLIERPADPFVTLFVNAQRTPLNGVEVHAR